jgi:hypothetical protein
MQRTGFFFALAVVCGVVSILRAGSSLSRDDEEGQKLVGSWIVTDPANPTAVPALATFTVDGAALSTNTTLGTGTTPAGSPHHGAWVRIGDRRFAATTFFVRPLGPLGQFTGTAKIRQTITVNRTSDAWSALQIVDTFDASGNLVSSAPRMRQAKRIRVEPLP